MLELQNVSFRYTPKGKNILSGFSASFGEGELVAITGRNGSGKTTMTRLLVGLEKPSEGKVIYNGKNITQEDASERSHFIGYVFQQPDRQMFMPTVREEVAFGPRMQGLTGKALDDAVENAMRAVDVQVEADRYPRSLPRGRERGYRSASTCTSTARMAFSTASSNAFPVNPCIRGPNATSSLTVGINICLSGCWNTYPIK